jgi:hypothetical protein
MIKLTFFHKVDAMANPGFDKPFHIGALLSRIFGSGEETRQKLAGDDPVAAIKGNIIQLMPPFTADALPSSHIWAIQ